MRVIVGQSIDSAHEKYSDVDKESRTWSDFMLLSEKNIQIKVNDYYEPEHFRAICEDNYNISRTCEYEKNEMHHIHNTCEILFVEKGSAEYYISGKKYSVEPYDILIIGPREHHSRRINSLPFSRYGLTIKPNYYRSIILDEELIKVFTTPSQEEFKRFYKNIDPIIFNRLVNILMYLRMEDNELKPFHTQIQRTIMTQVAVELYRTFKFVNKVTGLRASNNRMLEIKEYIDTNFTENLSLNTLSEKFFLHSTTISAEFNKCCGYNINKYINMVRVCEAAKLLESTCNSVSDISEKCGYSSENTFLRQFKLVMEVSPLQYRKSIIEYFNRSKRS